MAENEKTASVGVLFLPIHNDRFFLGPTLEKYNLSQGNFESNARSSQGLRFW